MLSDSELRAWAENLAPKNVQRLSIIKDLIRNANSDSMTPDDRTDCQRALQIIPFLPERVAPIKLDLSILDAEVEQ